MNIVYFGAAYNPPSRAHIVYLQELSRRFDLVLASPNWKHSFGKQMFPYEVRCEWLKQMMLDHNVSSNVELSKIEQDIGTDKPVYSIDVAIELEKRYPNAVRHLAFGYDNILNLGKFYRADELVQKINIYGLQKFDDVELANTRSTQIRQCIENNDWNNVERMTSSNTMLKIQNFTKNM